jgi:His-Xaa-Ser system protein HxsD
MVDFTRKSDKEVSFHIDLSIFNERLIAKVLYCYSKDYFVYWRNKEEQIQEVILEKKDGTISNDFFKNLKEKINQDLIDFKNRDIINQETKNIRDILYVKAFANNDNFEDFNLTSE